MSSVGVDRQPELVSRPDAGIFAALIARPVILGLLLVVATVTLYYPVHGHPFVNFDDNDYVYDNPQIQSGLSLETVKWAFTTSIAANWHPLTWLSHALDCQLFGDSPAGPHDVNVLLHVLDAVLLFWVLLRATGYAGRSFMVAALFALHPLNVESVAWIAERKTMLSAAFFLLALGAYRWYAHQPRVGRYAVVALLFALGLMAKPQIIMLPFVLLLWDYWPLQRISFPFNKESTQPRPAQAYPARTIWWLLCEKLPLCVIALASAAITIKVQHGARNWFPRTSRVGNAILSYGLYLRNTFWPSRLALMYPHAGASISWWHVSASALVLLIITALVIAGRRYRYLSVGWCWYLIMLLPMLGIVQVGIQAMADRYAYLSVLGIFLMVCWGVADWAAQKHLSASLCWVSVVVLLAVSLMGRRQLGYWQNNELLWSRSVQVTKRNWLAEGQLGAVLAMQGRVREAMPHFYRAIAINPSDSTSNMAIAIYLQRRGDFAGALDHYRVVVKDKSAKASVLAQAYEGMSRAYEALGDTADEEESLQAAKRLSH